MQIVIVDRPGSILDEAVAALKADGVAAMAAPADVTDRASLAKVKADADRLGPVTVLMCNAGREGGGSLFASEDIWRSTLETNLWGVIHSLQLFVPDMVSADRARRGGGDRLQAGHHAAARRYRLQCLESGPEGAH